MNETDTQTTAVAEQDKFFFPERIDMRRKNEDRYINKPYPYTEFTRAWEWHKRVAEWAFKGRSPEVIAKLCSLDVMTVRRIINHAPIAAWIEYMRERLRNQRELADESKAEVAEVAFNVTKGIVIGEEKPEKTRLDACKMAMNMDPHGRYQPYDAVNDHSRAPLGTDEWRDFIANKSVIDVEAIVIEDEDKEPENECKTGE